jgi:PAS domain S-box-containing protein
MVVTQGPFWSVFEHSNIPMALVDRGRAYIAVNDAAVELFQYQRDDVIGERAGRTTLDPDLAQSSAEWDELLRTGELYGERVVSDASGNSVRVSYAAHVTQMDGEWAAVLVALSAHIEPEGAELIHTSPAARNARLAGLTPREQEVVRQVALGRSTPQIAADLNLSPATVRSHVRNAMVKTGAHTRAQLVAVMLGEGLTASQTWG